VQAAITSSTCTRCHGRSAGALNLEGSGATAKLRGKSVREALESALRMTEMDAVKENIRGLVNQL
jgi:mono/diheme cytochrome c family protein